MKIAILSHLSPDALDWLQSHHECSVVINPQSDEKSRLLADAEVVVLRSPVKLDTETLARAPRLQVIVRAGMGLDGIDVDAARSRGITILTVPLSAQSVAEHTFALMLGLHRRIPWHHRMLQENRWLKHHGTNHDIHGRTLGLIGFGRIGIRTAMIARAFEMKICAFDRSPEKPHKESAARRLGVRFSGLTGLLRESDVIAIQAPLDASTHRLIGAPQIALMKPGAYLINVGRGEIVEEDALFNALRNGRIAGAALDVFAQEPALNHPLLTLENFIGTPHIAGQTEEAQRQIGSEVVQLIEAWAGRKPREVFQTIS